MKQVGTCPECKQEFECTNENEYSDGYECTKGHLSKRCDLNTNFVPLTVDEAQEYAEFLERGETHKYHIGIVGKKVGDIDNCEKCGKITDVIEYGGLTNNKNTSTMCACEEHEHDKWYESCGDSDCDVHGDLDVEELKKENEEYEARMELIREIFDKYPPKNDGILELCRIMFLFGNSWGKENTGGNYIYIHDEFIKYCADHNLLTRHL